jgi:hypothetical protein
MQRIFGRLFLLVTLSCFGYSLAVYGSGRHPPPGTRGTGVAATNAVPEADDEAVRSLVGLLGSRNARTRNQAAEALGALGPAASNAVHALMGLLGDEKSTLAATRALSRIGAPATNSLQAATASANPLMRKAAAMALGTCGTNSATCRECPWNKKAK